MTHGRTAAWVGSLAAIMAPLAFATAAPAQDGNTLNRHLEHQQWQRLQDHQNRSRQMNARDGAPQQGGPRRQARACSADALPAADRRRMETEYGRRVRADGRSSADAWIREQGRQFRMQLIAEGVCAEPDGEGRTVDRRATTSENGCRMVMRPVAGLGGAPMTMAMTPECD